MATSTGKTVLLVLLVILVAIFFFRAIPLLFAFFHFFPGTFHLKFPHFFPGAPGAFIMLFPTILLLVLWIGITIWVYRDAENRGMNGVLWALLVLVGNIIGLLVYLIVRNEALPRPVYAPSGQTCPQCGKPVSANFTYCPYCGRKTKMECPACKKPVSEEWQVCPYCGSGLKENNSTD